MLFWPIFHSSLSLSAHSVSAPPIAAASPACSQRQLSFIIRETVQILRVISSPRESGPLRLPEDSVGKNVHSSPEKRRRREDEGKGGRFCLVCLCLNKSWQDQPVASAHLQVQDRKRGTGWCFLPQSPGRTCTPLCYVATGPKLGWHFCTNLHLLSILFVLLYMHLLNEIISDYSNRKYLPPDHRKAESCLLHLWASGIVCWTVVLFCVGLRSKIRGRLWKLLALLRHVRTCWSWLLAYLEKCCCSVTICCPSCWDVAPSLHFTSRCCSTASCRLLLSWISVVSVAAGRQENSVPLIPLVIIPVKVCKNTASVQRFFFILGWLGKDQTQKLWPFIHSGWLWWGVQEFNSAALSFWCHVNVSHCVLI